jgi:hypothetical protein
MAAGKVAAARSEAEGKRGDGDDQGGKIAPTKWWQWMLLYPALVTSIIAAIPTYLEFGRSQWLGVPFGQYRSAVRENQLWKENIDCAAAPFDGLANKHNVQVDAVVCKSGNVLVRVKSPEGSTAYHWVPLETVTSLTRNTFDFLPDANAQSLAPAEQVAQGNVHVICQWWVGNGQIRRRVRDLNTNRCFDEVVNTYNGIVLSSTPAPCNC